MMRLLQLSLFLFVCFFAVVCCVFGVMCLVAPKEMCIEAFLCFLGFELIFVLMTLLAIFIAKVFNLE